MWEQLDKQNEILKKHKEQNPGESQFFQQKCEELTKLIDNLKFKALVPIKPRQLSLLEYKFVSLNLKSKLPEV